MDNFIKLPNNLIWSYKEDEYTLMDTIGDKVLYILPYIDLMTNRLNMCNFSLEDIIVNAGYKVDTHKNKSVEQFKTTLQELQLREIIYTNTDFNNVKPKELISCMLDIPFKKKDDVDTEFFSITHDNFLKILSDDSKLDKITLIKIYFYINARLSRRVEEDIDFKHYVGGKSNSFYGTYDTICKDLKITDTVLTKYLKRLQELELVFFDNIGLLQDLLEGTIYTANNVYVIDKKELEQALKESKLYYKECINIVILGKKSKEETKKIIGLNGKIIQEKNKKNKNNVDKLEKKLKQLSEKSNNRIGERDNLADQSQSNNETLSSLNNKNVWGEDNPFDKDTLSITDSRPHVEPLKDNTRIINVKQTVTQNRASVPTSTSKEDTTKIRKEITNMCKIIKEWDSSTDLLSISTVKLDTLENCNIAYNNFKEFIETNIEP